MLSKLGGTDVTFHACQHTHAALLWKAGEHPKVVAEQLGHASVKTTRDLYSHVIETPTSSRPWKSRPRSRWTPYLANQWQTDEPKCTLGP